MKSGKEQNTIEKAMAQKHIGKLKDLAARIGCSERSLRGWLKGEHIPNAYYIGQISNVLDINARRIFSKNEDDEDMEKISRRGFISIVGAAAGASLITNDASWQRLEHALNNHVHIDDETITQLNTITQSYWQLRTNLNTDALWHGINGHLDNVSQILHQSLLPQSRERLCGIAGEVALMSGTMAHVGDDRKTARAFYRAGLRAAHEGDIPDLGAIIHGRIALSFNNDSHYQEALQAVTEGLKLGKKANPTTLAWLSVVKAETHANLQDNYHTRLELDRAQQFNERIEPGEYSYWSGYDQSRFIGYQGSCYVLLGDYSKATSIIKEAMSLTPRDMSRRHAMLYTQLANISLHQGHIEECCSYAGKALLLAQQTRYGLIIHRLQKFVDTLKPYAQVAEVKQLSQQITTASFQYS